MILQIHGLTGMNTKKKRIAPKKRLIKHFLALTMAGTLLLPGLVLIRSETVEANVIVDMASGVIGKLRYNATVAEIIVSLMAGSGAGVTNTRWLNQLNQSYGVNSTLASATGTDGTIGSMYEAGLFDIADDGTFIDNGLMAAIESQPAYTNCDIGSYMGTWNDAGTTVVTEASENIGNSISAGAVFGTVCQVVGAVSMGVKLGVLANNIINKVGDKMAAQKYIDNNSSVPSGMYQVHVHTTNPSGNSWRTSNNSFNIPRNSFICSVPSDSSRYYYVANLSSDRVQWQYGALTYSTIQGDNYPTDFSTNTIYPNANGFVSMVCRNIESSSSGIYNFNTENEALAFINSVRNGSQTVVSPSSPDMIGKNGNQRPSNNASDYNDVTSWPDMGEQAPEGQGIKPIPWDDYMDWVDIANDNTMDNITTIPQGDLFNDFIDDYYVTPQEIPDVQSPDYNPSVPEQPVPNPKEELTSEESQENTDYMTTPGLKDVFPFSIPWDIAGLFNVFSTDNREAPVITFPIKSQLFGIDEEITLDFSVYEDVAALLRLLELIGFGLGLAFVTRYLIGAGGG